MRSMLRLVTALTFGSALVLGWVGSPAHAEDPAPKSKDAKTAEATAVAQDPEQALRERVKGYWDARVARSPKVFDYYLPAAKGGSSGGESPNTGAVFYEKYEITDVKIDGDTAKVNIQAQASVSVPKSMTVPEQVKHPKLNEVWHRTDGVWYRQPYEVGISKYWNKTKKGPAAEKPPGGQPPTGSPAPPAAPDAGATEGAKK